MILIPSQRVFIPKSPEPLYRNFRSCMKKIAMEPSIRIPIQILRPATIDPESPETQNSATKAWNFCTEIYYKSGNHPWILDNMDSKSCYLGISFYHKKTLYGDDVYTAMAHLFSNDFADIVLKGKPVNLGPIWIINRRSPYYMMPLKYIKG